MELVPVYNDVPVCYGFEYILSLIRVNVCLKICVNSGRKSVKPLVKMRQFSEYSLVYLHLSHYRINVTITDSQD